MRQEQIHIFTLIFAMFMFWLAWRDWRTFRSGAHINYKPIIVSIGLLGTFVGIVLGLLEFDTRDISASVPQLLEGLKLAFLTSIIGMGLSVLLSWLQALPEPDNYTIIQQLNIINKALVKALDSINQQLIHTNTKLDTNNKFLMEVSNGIKQLSTDNQTLTTILGTVKQLKDDIYQRRYRFAKLDATGQALPEETSQWAAIQDNETGLIWEIKTNNGGLQDGRHTYTWYEPDDDIVGKENGGDCMGCRCDTQAYVAAINKMQLAGYRDWRVPTIEELETLANEQTPIDKRYFPNIQSAWYCSSTAKSGEDDTLWCINFDTRHRGYGKYGHGHVLLVRKGVRKID